MREILRRVRKIILYINKSNLNMMSRDLMNCSGVIGPFRSVLRCEERKSLGSFYRAVFRPNEISVENSMGVKPRDDFQRAFRYAIFRTIIVKQILIERLEFPLNLLAIKKKSKNINKLFNVGRINGVNRHPLKGQKFNRQPSKKSNLRFNRQKSSYYCPSNGFNRVWKGGLDPESRANFR